MFDHSEVVGAAPVGNCILILDLTPSFNELGKDGCKTRRELFKFWDSVHLILETLQYIRHNQQQMYWSLQVKSDDVAINIDVLVQERCNSIANALELHLSCTNSSI